jgi:rhodanese-related sulfurtransferase
VGVIPGLLLQQLRSGRCIQIIDLRDDDDVHRLGWIAGTRRIPLRQLLVRRAELAGLESEPIVLVSGQGVSAEGAAAALRLAGFHNVTALAGGFARWLSLGLPVESTQRMHFAATIA